MLVLEIRLNGEHKATCGTEAMERLTTLLTAKRKGSGSPKDFELRIECLGREPIDEETYEVLKWVSARVQLGDEISFRFVEAASSQEPIDRQTVAKNGDTPDA